MSVTRCHIPDTSSKISDYRCQRVIHDFSIPATKRRLYVVSIIGAMPGLRFWHGETGKVQNAPNNSKMLSSWHHVLLSNIDNLHSLYSVTLHMIECNIDTNYTTHCSLEMFWKRPFPPLIDGSNFQLSQE